jgi:hypothetical protein
MNILLSALCLLWMTAGTNLTTSEAAKHVGENATVCVGLWSVSTLPRAVKGHPRL